jgi:hypothetical protein|tara:strand:- start:148 stop:987 length:840 start_codon:yes stop_codon:yes gene_type:complete
MRSKKLLVLTTVLLLITILPTILASTEFKIDTVPDHRISLIIREDGKLSTLDSHHTDTSSEIISYSTSVSPNFLEVLISLKKDGIKLMDTKFSSLQAGDTYTITIKPGQDIEIISASELAAQETEKTDEPEEPVEEEVEDTKSTEEEPEESPEENQLKEPEATETEDEPSIQASPTTGFAISNLIPSGKFSYVLWIVIGVGALLFIIIIARGKMNSSGNAQGSTSIDDKRLQKAENKLKEAQTEIDRIKNRSDKERKLKEAQERFKKDQDEIKKLRSDL